MTFGSWSKKASGKERSRKKKTRTAIVKLFALHINSARILIITFLKFLKLNGYLLELSNLVMFLIKREICKKPSAVEPDFSF